MEKASRFLANSSTALEQLRGLIHQHESTPGIPLPTERELSDTLGVGRREVRRALDVLEEEGRIWRKQGKGTFIGPAAPVEPSPFRDWFSKPTYWKSWKLVCSSNPA